MSPALLSPCRASSDSQPRRLANLALPAPGIKFKQSQMPFVQMENISHFLKACELPPLNMPSHDRFLTVDLYESKDPAQVLQCLSAFSRVANGLLPAKFPTAIGGRRSHGALSPASTGAAVRNGVPGAIRGAHSMSSMQPSAAMPSARPLSPTKTGGSTTSSNPDGMKSAGPISSWSKRTDQGSTAPAWNIHQYGYMGGASQGNQGILFGGRRQITTASPIVPSLAEKERKRKEKEAEEERLRIEAEEAERQRRLESEAEEERARIDEERKWEEETKRLREEERRRLDDQKRQWEEEEQRWKAEEEARQREEAEMARQRPTGLADEEPDQADGPPKQEEDTPEGRRVKELEKQLEEARERERQYQLEREQRTRQEPAQVPQQPPDRVDGLERHPSAKESEASWAPDEREALRQAAPQRSGLGSFRPLPTPAIKPAEATRPLPNPSTFQPKPRSSSRTVKLESEEPAERDVRSTPQQSPKPGGGWASKSLLEREMERERERQKEWEANQEATKNAPRDASQGTGPNQSWSSAQYGYMGGDNQNRGTSAGSGIAMGGRRQIIGPRPQPGAR